jgi:hypothetical protein
MYLFVAFMASLFVIAFSSNYVAFKAALALREHPTPFAGTFEEHCHIEDVPLEVDDPSFAGFSITFASMPITSPR